MLILTDFSGRIDQAMSQINTLFTQSGEIYLMTHDTLAWILRPGVHRLAIPEHFVEGQFWCSYIPVGSACQVTTRGLKYDLGMAWLCVFILLMTMMIDEYDDDDHYNHEYIWFAFHSQ